MLLKHPRCIGRLLAVGALCLMGGCEKSSSRTTVVSSDKAIEKPAATSGLTPDRKPDPPTGTPGQSANPQKEGETAMRLYDRIRAAVDEGRMTLKDAVLIEAKLLYNPALLPADSPYRLDPDDTGFAEECLTGFNKDVHRVFPQLSEEERELLKSLDPGLKTVIEQKEKEASRKNTGQP